MLIETHRDDRCEKKRIIMTHAMVTNQELHSLVDCGPSRVLRIWD